jgi:multimeric flavodoxin WrbA
MQGHEYMSTSHEANSGKIVAVLGSPRRRGNSDTLALEFLRGARSRGAEHSLIVPTDLGLSSCDGRNRCFKDGRCAIQDGINEIYDRVLQAPYLLVAAPVYFMGPPGSLKAFIDRFQAVWARSAILGEFDPDSPERRARHKSFAVIVGATKGSDSMYKPTRSILKAFCNVTGFEYTGDLVADGLDNPGDAAKRDDLLKKAYEAGRTFVTGNPSCQV